MSVEQPQAFEVFTVRTYKRASGYTWANTYEIQANEPGRETQDLVGAALAIVDAESIFHLSYVVFDRVVISTYVPDGSVYNPSSFRTINLVAIRGQRNVVDSQPLPLPVCVFARFNASVGRAGKRFYRGCLAEEDVDSALVSHSLSSGIRAFITNALNPLSGEFRPGITMVLARGRPAPTNIREVNLITVAQLATMKKLNNRYFDFPGR